MIRESEELEQKKEAMLKYAMLRLSYAVKEGFYKQLLALLRDFPDEEDRRALINQEIYDFEDEENEHQVHTPLIIACMNGHADVVRVLLTQGPADLEKEGCVKLHGEMTQGVTALWVAAGLGRLNIVKLLIQHGAQVDHATRKGSTPLRAACFDGRLDLIQYLVAHQANVDTANVYNNTCLMIAAYKNYVDVLQYLLEQGARVNEQAQCGASALFYAAECGHVEVCERLLDHGAMLLRNTYGLTPALAAAERTREATVLVFLDRPNLLTREERIEVLELLGASYANDKNNYNVMKAFTYLMMGMEERYKDPENIIRKPTLPPVPAYEHWVECQTVQDLHAIRYNHNSLHMESLTIRERILGRKCPEVVHSIIFRGAVCADNGRFDRCESLWLHALRLRQQNGLSVQRDLLRFVQLFSQEFSINEPMHFEGVLAVLGACVDELRYNQQKLAQPGPRDDTEAIGEDYEMNVVTVLYLVTIVTKLLRIERFPRTEQQTLQAYQMIYQLNQLAVRLRDDQTLLHLSVNGVAPVDDFHTDDVCRFPCADTVKLLLKCGALVDVVDYERNTPLHTLVGTVDTSRLAANNMVEEVKEITEVLVQAGVHLDAVNSDGLKASQVCLHPEMAIFVKSYETRAINLRCLSARTIAQHRIPFRNQIPRQLVSFVECHCAPKG
ncbi:protein fem-1 homolog B [Anopheles ziemanni]|uniref:protein fem-1 homolog B n=1 Tax=Anopheles coustani TaxID=139045 RepID=UPI00265A6EFB|nr:protein fem-1 homolog B [Anopheles coustani]XP_058168227.1 protein fem-1 homolog B [Anopheles ziemanni]